MCDAIVNDLEMIRIAPRILTVADQHVHLIAKFGEVRIRPTVGRLRFAATQKLREKHELTGRIWAKGCHMESLNDSAACEDAVMYVLRHAEQGAVVFEWAVD